MTIDDLARKLIDAQRDTHGRLLQDNAELADTRLAESIRRECVDAWAKDPKRVQACVVAATSLEEFSPDPLIQANAEWVRGIAALTRGKFEKAVEYLTGAGELLIDHRRDADAANSRVALLLALAMLGRYDEAILAGRSAVPVLVKSGDELAAGKIEMNLSNIVSRRGEHQAAYGFCESARRRFIRANEPTWQAMAENGLANTAAELNNFAQAERFYRMALRTAEAADMHVTEAEIIASMGNLALLRGHYADAVRHLEVSRQRFEKLAMPHQSAIADLEIADIYGELNLNAEAAEIYERVGPALIKLKLRAEEARARLNYGRTLVATGKSTPAGEQLGRASELYSQEGNAAGEAAATLAKAHLAFSQTRYDEALEISAKAKGLAVSSGNERLVLAVEILVAQAHLARKDIPRARRVLDKLVDEAKRLRQSDAERSALNLLGQAAIVGGDSAAATKYFRRSIRIVEQLRAPLAFEEFSMSFLAARLEPYENLARVQINGRKFGAAFETIEKARSRALVDAMAGATAESASDPGDAELQQIREELNSYYKRIDRADDEEIDALRKLAAEKENALAGLTRSIASLKTKSAAASADFTRKKLAKQLGRARTLIEFVELDGDLSAFVVTAKAVEFVSGMAKPDDITALLEALRFQFETLRYGATLPQRFADQIRSRTDSVLARLYDKLIRPIEKHLTGKSLVVVPAGVLHYVPFAGLFDGTKYLVERFEIAHAPSATVWSKLSERKRRTISNSLLVGFADEKIPLVESEISSLKQIAPEPKALTGEKATLAAFAKNPPGRDLIHLACHGEFRTDNPMFSSLHLADGWITVRDLVEQRLDAQLVTLSACETGLNKIHAGDELLGLARGFLTAGAASLVVTLWRVNDEAALGLMGDFYKKMQRGFSISSSLQDAQKMAVRRGDSPYLWAPFVYMGR